MSKRFGRSFDVLPLKMKGPGSKFMSAFERIKRHFGRCGGNMVYELPLNISAKNVDREFFDYEEREVRLTTWVLLPSYSLPGMELLTCFTEGMSGSSLTLSSIRSSSWQSSS